MLTRPVGYPAIVAMFGDPNSFRMGDGTLSAQWEIDNIVRVPLPRSMAYSGGGVVTRIAVNRVIYDVVDQTMKAAAEHDDIWSELTPYGGGYEPRLKRGSSEVSLHTFGIALDFNPKKYPLGSLERMPQDIIDLFHSFGWWYGGDFEGRKDPQHFQFAEGY